MQLDTYENTAEYLSNLFLEKRLALFFGAGLSFNSGVPLVISIIHEISQSLGMGNVDSSVLECCLEISQSEAGRLYADLRSAGILSPSNLVNHQYINSAADTIPLLPKLPCDKYELFQLLEDYHGSLNSIQTNMVSFERLFLAATEGKDIHELLKVFDVGSPNANHKLIARLAKDGFLKIICTTNFDTLLEQAMRVEGMREGEEFIVYRREDDFAQLDHDEKRIQIIKPHGSIDDYESIVITLHRVGKRALMEERRLAMEHVFSRGAHDAVLLAGYSLSDIDLMQLLAGLPSDRKRIYHIDHKPDSNSTKLEEYQPDDRLDGYTCSGIAGNTDQIVRRVVRLIFPDDAQAILAEPAPPSDEAWKQHINNWANALTPWQHTWHAAKICQTVNDIDRAYNRYKHGYGLSKASNSSAGKGSHLSGLGTCQVAKQKYEDALQSLTEAVSYSQHLDVVEQIVRNMNNIGICQEELGELDSAMDSFKKAAKLAEENNDQGGTAVSIACIAGMLREVGSYKEAIHHYHDAVLIMEQHGLLEQLVRLYNHLGICQAYLPDVEAAKNSLQRASDLAESIGDRFGECDSFTSMAIIYAENGEIERAEELYRDAVSASKEIEEKHGKASAENISCIGHAEYLIGNLDVALKYTLRGFSIYQTRRNPNGMVTALLNATEICKEKGDEKQARKLAKQAVDICAVHWPRDYFLYGAAVDALHSIE